MPSVRVIVGYALNRTETERVIDLYESNDKRAVKVSTLGLQWHVGPDEETLYLGEEHVKPTGQVLTWPRTTVDGVLRNVRHVLESMQLDFKSERFGFTILDD